MDGAQRAGGTGIPWGMPHTSRGGRICTDLTVCTPTVTHRCRAAALPGVACPARARLFWKSREKSTRGFGPWTPGDSWSTRRSSLGTRHVMACRDRLHLFGCLVVENWIFGGSGFLLICGKLLLYLRGCSNLSAPLAKGGCRRRRLGGGDVEERNIVAYKKQYVMSPVVTISLPAT